MSTTAGPGVGDAAGEPTAQNDQPPVEPAQPQHTAGVAVPDDGIPQAHTEGVALPHDGIPQAHAEPGVQ